LSISDRPCPSHNPTTILSRTLVPCSRPNTTHIT
jgi:hypothetical protein